MWHITPTCHKYKALLVIQQPIVSSARSTSSTYSSLTCVAVEKLQDHAEQHQVLVLQKSTYTQTERNSLTRTSTNVTLATSAAAAVGHQSLLGMKILNLDPGHPLIIKPDKQSKEVKENHACNRKKMPNIKKK